MNVLLSTVCGVIIPSPSGASVLEVVKAFEEASQRKVPYEIVSRRPGDVASSYATCELAEKELGWKSKLSLYDMCKCKLHRPVPKGIFEQLPQSTGKDVWTWQSKNPQGYHKRPS